MSELPAAPWESVITDFYGPLKSGEYLLSIIDEYSRFPVVKIVDSTATKSSIPVYDEIFSEFGIPKNVKSDDGAPFNSSEFTQFAKYLGFHHQKITPFYPHANGMVEIINKRFTKIMMTSKVEKVSWKKELYKFLRSYRLTPHCTTKEVPAKLMFPNRRFFTRTPELTMPSDDDFLRNTDLIGKEKIKRYAEKRSRIRASNLRVGDYVLVKKRRLSKSDPYYDPTPYMVSNNKGNMVTASRKDHVITRNSSFFKYIDKKSVPRDEQMDNNIEDDDTESVIGIRQEHQDNEVENNDDEENESVLRRSTRVTPQPVRNPMDVI